MICNICGQQLPDDSKFCSRCGAKLFEVNNNQNSSQNTDSQTPNPDLNQNQNPSQYPCQNQEYKSPPAQYQNNNQNYNRNYQNQNSNYGNFPNQAPSNTNSNVNTFALVGFVIGIISWFLNLWGIVAICAIIFSSIALANLKNLVPRNKAFAIIGLISGICNVIYVILILLNIISI